MNAPLRKPLKKISDRKLKSLGGKTPFSTISKRSESPRKSKDKATDKGWTKKALPSVANQKQEPRTRTRPTNPQRKAREFKRAYHSEERVRFVKSLPCCACKVGGYTENAHIETGGTGRKADYDKIVPLCGMRSWKTRLEENWYIGCHRRYDELLQDFTERFQLDMEAEARRTELAWQSRIQEREE